MDDREKGLVREAVGAALASVPADLAAMLTAFGWAELAEADDAFAVTTLFEELGRRARATNALDIVTANSVGLAPDLTVLWPLSAPRNLYAKGRSAAIDGVALCGVVAGRLYVPGADGLHLLEVSSVTETTLGGMAEGMGWMGVRAEGSLGGGVGDWCEIERRSRLALSSELVGVAERTVDVAAEHVSGRKQFGQPIGAYQAVRFRLAEAYAETAGARALVAAAWEDGSVTSAHLAHAAASLAGDAVAKHALQVCGAIGFSAEHALPGLVKRTFALAALLGTSSPGQFGVSLEGVTAPVASF